MKIEVRRMKVDGIFPDTTLATTSLVQFAVEDSVGKILDFDEGADFYVHCNHEDRDELAAWFASVALSLSVKQTEISGVLQMTDTNLVCLAKRCACIGVDVDDECCCIPDGDHDRARCVECAARMVLIDINTGLPLDPQSLESLERK